MPAVSSTAVSEAESQVPALQRGLAILEFLTDHREGCTAAELSQALEISGASAFRLTNALVELGYLQRDEKTRRYTLTQKLLRMGQPQGADRSLAEAAIDALRAVREATGETTQLCCLSGQEVVILDQLAAVHPFKYLAEIGARCPCYSCAPGKAIAAFLPSPARQALLTGLHFKRFTSTTLTSRREFERELAEVRQTGFAIDRAEGMEGIHCVAAPVLDRHGHPIAAITIAGPAARIPVSKFAMIGRQVIQAATQTAQRFGH